MLQRTRGFTLIEVTVAVSIVAILAALTFPALAGAREKARQTACMGNLKQLYAAVALYATDYDSGLSIAVSDVSPQSVIPYGATHELMYCPDFPNSLKARVSTSYQWNFVHSRLKTDSDELNKLEDKLWKMKADELEQMGDQFPLMICFTHDELFYQPRERHLDPLLSGAYVIEVRTSGNVFVGRMPYGRGNTIDFLSDAL